MMLCNERASVEEERVEGGGLMQGASEEGRNEAWTARGKEGREEASGGGIELGMEGAREQGRVYSQTNHSQTGPCP